MRNYIGLENLVALLKCVSLFPNQNWNKYAFWSLCFCANNQVPPEEILEGGKYGVMVDNTTDGIYRGMKQILQRPDLNDLKALSHQRT